MAPREGEADFAGPGHAERREAQPGTGAGEPLLVRKPWRGSLAEGSAPIDEAEDLDRLRLYQLTPFKDACLGRCRSPAAFLSRHHEPGLTGAFRLGVLHGAYCVGCCWMLMSLLFVGGVMNLIWVASLTLLVAAEKLLPGGHWLARIAGITMIVWGAALIFR